MRALLLDPLVTDVHTAERFLDAILDAHRAYLPRFWS
jgi:alpha-galactosidase/6-phospho-beta-glucosidase family protein